MFDILSILGGTMKLLIVEDNFELANSYRNLLTNQNIVCDIAVNGNEALTKLSTIAYDLMLLDINLPDMYGTDVLRNLKSKNESVGVIMVTAQIDDKLIVESLNRGADDYLTKPVNQHELIARVHALHRRLNTNKQSVLELDNLVVDYPKNIITCNGNPLKLTNKEYLILTKLCELHPGYASSQELLNAVFDEYVTESSSLRVHIYNIKRKLKTEGIGIESSKGQGYRLCFQV